MLNPLEALERFFAEAGTDVWMAGHLPDQAAFPYLLWDAALPAPYETEPLEAAVWFRGPDAQEQRWQCLRRLEQALPPGGRRLDAGRGCLLLRRGSPFVRFLSDRELLGIGVKVLVRNCGAA